MVRVLGPIEIECDGRQVLTRGTSRRQVIAMLAAHRTAGVTLDQLTEVMHSSPAAIHTIVSRLRHDLGPDVLRTTSTGYAMDPQRCDATLTERLLAEARRSGTAEALSLIEQALSSWRGRAFGEFADQAWAEAEAARLDELEHTAHEDYADLLLEAGRHDEAIVELKGHIVTYPLRDRPRRSLMIGLHRAGRTAEALREFQAYRRYLADEVGIEPSPATIAVDRVIAAGGRPPLRRSVLRDPRESGHRGESDGAAVARAIDVEGIGLALARFVLHEGHPELAARAVGACGSSGTMDGLVAVILDEVGDAVGTGRLQELLADGRHGDRSELYRELWSTARPLLENSTEPGAISTSE